MTLRRFCGVATDSKGKHHFFLSHRGGIFERLLVQQEPNHHHNNKTHDRRNQHPLKQPHRFSIKSNAKADLLSSIEPQSSKKIIRSPASTTFERQLTKRLPSPPSNAFVAAHFAAAITRFYNTQPSRDFTTRSETPPTTLF